MRQQEDGVLVGARKGLRELHGVRIKGKKDRKLHKRIGRFTDTTIKTGGKPQFGSVTTWFTL